MFRIEDPDGKKVKVNNNQWYIAYKNAKKIPDKDGRVKIWCFDIPIKQVRKRK